MTITVKQEVTVVKDVTLPYFFKRDDWFNKIETEEVSYRVTAGETYISLCKQPSWLAKQDAANGTEITEAEFNAAWDAAMKGVAPSPHWDAAMEQLQTNKEL